MASRTLTLASLPFVGFRKVWETLFVRNMGTASKAINSSTVDKEEITKFTENVDGWWADTYKPLHAMNSIRVPFIRDGILSLKGNTTMKSVPLEGYKIIDVGCGGGILSEPLARLGASVTGLDPGQENIKIATAHSLQDEKIKDKLEYVCDTVENLALMSPNSYDALVCSEVIEHVANVEIFVKSCVELTKDGGSLFFTTINRTAVSYMLSILGAEYVLQILPQGTHDWNKFVRPEELSEMLQSLNCRIVSVQGSFYNPLTQKWGCCESKLNTYSLHAVK